jgi:SAM-dependent methyltransferase
MGQNDLYDAYPNDAAHMKDYVAYQQRYAVNIRESDRVLLDLIATQLRQRKAAAGACTLLDIGCSTGNLLRHIKQAFPALRLAGGELSDMQLEICRKDPELAGIEFLRADLRSLPRERPYDMIVANAILYGFDQPSFAQCVASIAGALKPGGSLLAFDFFHPWKQEIAIVEKTGTFPGGHPLHFRSYGSTERVFKEAGFVGLEFRPFAIPIDLPRPALDTDHVESYTVPTRAGERLLFRGAICQPWCHLVARTAGAV